MHHHWLDDWLEASTEKEDHQHDPAKGRNPCGDKKMLKKYDVHRVSYTESTPHFSCAQEIQMYLHVQTQFKKTDF